MRGSPGAGVTVPRGRLARLTVAAVVAASVLAACGGGDDDDTARGSTTSTTTTSTTTTSTTSTTGTSTTGTSTSPSCPPAGGTAEVRDEFPARMSSLVGKDVRTGTHDCYERFVIELQSSGGPTSSAFPGLLGPVRGRARHAPAEGRAGGDPGDAALLVSMGSPMRTADDGGYQGPTDVTPNGDTVIREYRLVEDFEGQSTWAIGLDRQRSFTVTVLDGPPRLVVDIAT